MVLDYNMALRELQCKLIKGGMDFNAQTIVAVPLDNYNKDAQSGKTDGAEEREEEYA